MRGQHSQTQSKDGGSLPDVADDRRRKGCRNKGRLIRELTELSDRSNRHGVAVFVGPLRYRKIGAYDDSLALLGFAELCTVITHVQRTRERNK